MPVFSGRQVITDYTYDGGGRLDTEVLKQRTVPGGAIKNLFQTTYTYSWLTYGREFLVETKKRNAGDTAWDNEEKTEYEYTPLEWLKFEGRSQYSGSWAVVYDITQAYDKAGNRTGYDKNVAMGQTANFGRSENLTYTYDNNNRLTAVSDSDDSTYACVVTSDACGNITKIEEKGMNGMTQDSILTMDYTFDELNRMTSYKTTRYDLAAAKEKYSRRLHSYDGTGRIANSTLRTWETGQSEPAGDSLEHTYAGGKPLQNFDGTSTYGAVWVFAGAQNSWGPLKSPAPDTASQKDYNTGSKWQPNRRTYQVATAAAEGDKRLLYGQGRPMTKDASGTGSTWSVGTKSQPTTPFGLVTVESRFEYQGTVAPTDMSRATDVREKDRTGIFGNTLSYAGSYSRVTSEALGRDINPLGRGDGMAYVGGWMNLGQISPRLPLNATQTGQGGSVNNGPCAGCGLSGGAINGTPLKLDLPPGWGEHGITPKPLPPTGPLPLPPPESGNLPPVGDSPLPPIVIANPPSGGSESQPGQMNQACYDQWKRQREEENWVGCSGADPCLKCSCTTNPCSPDEWKHPVENDCVERYCTCKAEGCDCKGCCGTDCGASSSGVPCCPNHCINCDGNGGGCPCSDSFESNIASYRSCMDAATWALMGCYLVLMAALAGIALTIWAIAIIFAIYFACVRSAMAWMANCCDSSVPGICTSNSTGQLISLTTEQQCYCTTWCTPAICGV